ncbi:DNA-directed DNA polymerase [Tanacetum coccineum]
MASQDAKTSRFEADFKQYQGEMTNKLDTFLKAFNDQMTRLLPSDTVKNPKLNTNSTSSARSHPAGDPQSSSNSFKSVNAIQTCSKSKTCDKKDQLQVNTLMVLAHVPMYDALLDKYIVSLELGENRSEYIQSIAPKKMKDSGLFILPCRLGDSKPFDTLADLVSCNNLLPLKHFKELKVGLLKETDNVPGLADGTKLYPIGIVRNVEVHVEKLKKFKDFHVVDMEREPTCPLLVGRGFLTTVNSVIDCKKAKIAVGEDLLDQYSGDAEVNPFKDVLVFRKMVKFLGAIPINLKGNMWESEDLIENPID